MIATVTRTYFKNRISECMPDYTEWEDYFNSSNIPSTLLDYSYHIELGSTASGSFDDQSSLEEMSVTIRFFRKGFDTSMLQEHFDKLYDDVHGFKFNAQDPSKRVEPIKNVYATSVIPQPMDSNDNIMIVQVDFTVQFYFSL